MKSYVSALKGVLAEDNIEIHQDTFLLSSLMRACKFKNDTPRVRQPIRKAMLKELIKQTWSHFNHIQQPYLAQLYAALLSTTYFGLFRIGEVTSGSHLVKVQDVHLARNKLKVLFVLRSSETYREHSRNHSIKISSTITVTAKNVDYQYCLYKILHQYIAIRPKFKQPNESFFVFGDNSLVKPEQFRHVLKSIVQLSGFDSSNYEVHRLHMGKASDMLK